MENDENLLISIGRILTHFGKNGEFKVQLLTDFPDRFENLSSVILSKSGTKEDLIAKIQGVRYHKSFVLLKLDIANSIDDTVKYRDFFICLKKKDLKSLPDGNFYLFELIGLKVYSKEGEFLGTLNDIWKSPGHDIFVVLNKDKEILIPGVKEYIEEINPGSGKIILRSEIENILNLNDN